MEDPRINVMDFVLNIPLPDLPGQLENVLQSGNEIAKRGMPT